MTEKENRIERRKKPSKPRKFRKEKRQAMLIITKANQVDMYTWCLTVAASAGVILTFLVIAIVQGN